MGIESVILNETATRLRNEMVASLKNLADHSKFAIAQIESGSRISQIPYNGFGDWYFLDVVRLRSQIALLEQFIEQSSPQ